MNVLDSMLSTVPSESTVTDTRIVASVRAATKKVYDMYGDDRVRAFKELESVSSSLVDTLYYRYDAHKSRTGYADTRLEEWLAFAEEWQYATATASRLQEGRTLRSMLW